MSTGHDTPPRARVNQHTDRFADRRTHRRRSRTDRERAAIHDAREDT